MGVKESDVCAPLELPALIKELNQCIDTLSRSWDCATKIEFLKILKEGRYQILCIINKIRERNCHKDVNPAKEDLKRDIFQYEVEYEFEQMRINHLRKEWTRQQNKMAQLQETFYKKCRLLSIHSNYSSTQGNALCSILAALMGNPHVVTNFLADDKYLVDFIKIADGCLFSFTRSYASDTPLVDSTDYKFILALYTCIAYLTAVSEGSLFLIRRQEGQKALWSLIHVLPRIEHETAEKLMITLWKILYNVSKEEEGKTFLQDCSELPSTLEHYICRKYNPEIHKYTLETFDQVTKNVTNKEFLDKVTTMSSVQRLKELSGSMFELVRFIPKKILQNITRAPSYLLKTTEACPSTGAIPCDCETKPPFPEQESKSKTSVVTKHTIRIPAGSNQAAIRMVHKFAPGQSEPEPSPAFLLYPERSSFLKVGQTPMTPIEIEPLASCPLCFPPCEQLFEHPSTFKPGSFKLQQNTSAQSTCPLCKAFGSVVRSSHSAKPNLSKYQSTPYSFTSCTSPKSRTKECYVVMSTPTSVKTKDTPQPTIVDKSSVGDSYQISKSFVSPSGHTKVHISRLQNPSNDKKTQVCITKSIGTVMSKKSIKNETNDTLDRGTPPCYCIFSCNIKKFSFGKRRQKSLSYVLPYKPKPKKKKKLISSSNSSTLPSSTYPSIYTEDSEKLLSLFSSSTVTTASITLTKKVNKKLGTSTNVGTSDTLVEANTSVYNTEKNSNESEKNKTRASLIPVLIPKKLSQTVNQTSSMYLSSHSCSSKDYSQNSCVCSKGQKPSLIPIATSKKTSTLSVKNSKTEQQTLVTPRTVSRIPVAKKSINNASQKIKEKCPESLNETFSTNISTDESAQCASKTSGSKFKQIISPLRPVSERCKIFYDTWTGNKNEEDAPSQIHDDPVEDERKTVRSITNEEVENDEEYEDMIDSEICTCGSKSDKQLIPWSAEDHMIAVLGEKDRRVYSHSKTMRILNKINNKTTKKQQKIITRIKIPNLPFHFPESHS